ncbi:MAG: glycosyltransferase family 4 protein [Actinomycetota bacterium]|nr:glycosyltransferase family 4 protein [Actinomycetota bacterium]
MPSPPGAEGEQRSLVAVHQFVPTYAGRSAIGFHTHQVTHILRDMGVTSHTYVGSAHDVDDDHVHGYRRYEPVPGEPTWLLYQLSTGHPMADFLARRPEPLVVNYHNITPERFFLPWEPLVVPELRAGRDQFRRLAARTELAVAVSSYNERELVNAGYTRTVTTPFLADFEALGSEVNKQLSDELDRTKAAGGADLIFVGRIAPNKAQHRLIKVLAVYRRLYDPRARLWLIGGSSSHRYETSLVDYAAALGLGDAVHVTGSVHQADLVSYYGNADVLVSASDHEGFGVPLLEAMWHSVPVVALATSGVTDTVGDAGVVLRSKTADSAKMAAAVHRAVTDAALRDHLVERGRNRVAHFSLERSQEAFRAAIRPLLGL